MEIKHLKIRNFRGISELDWFLPGKYICLIGPGDCGKTTILDAIEYALYPYYTISFDDTDFHNCNTDIDIEIYVSVAFCPEEFYEDIKFGLYQRGINQNKIIDEPTDESISILTIRLTVGKSLEPEWTLHVERETDTKDVSHRMREKLGMMRIGTQVEKHFTWGRGSILNKWSENIDQAKAMISEAVRKAKLGFDEGQIEDLPEVISKISEASEKFGYKPKNTFKAHLDTKSISFGYGAISLNDDSIPVRQFGTGSKKLIASGLQVESTVEGAILLFDEIETGLEPHRLRNLIRVLKRELANKGQIIATTHSSVSLVEFDAANIVVVRNDNGVLTCRSFTEEIKNEFQGTFRRVPEAFFSNKVIVCEGATEFGFLLAYEDYLVSKSNDSFGYQGISVVDGKGDTFKQISKDLQSLGYKTSVLIDSDKLKEEEIRELKNSGINVINWDGNVSIEERVFLDIPENRIINFILLAKKILSKNKGEEKASQSVLNSINARLGSTFNALSELSDLGNYRQQIGEIAKKKEWFKRPDKAKKLGNMVFKCFEEIQGSDIHRKMEDLKSWIYA